MASRVGRQVWLLLAIVLVAAQALGLMHRIVHGPQVVLGQELAASHAHDTAKGHHDAHGSAWVDQLFSGHDDDSTCRLFDPLNHDAVPCVPVMTLPLALASFQLLFSHGDFVARWSTLFDARGPPALR